MDIRIHKAKTMMDGIKEKLENRNKRKNRMCSKNVQLTADCEKSASDEIVGSTDFTVVPKAGLEPARHR